MTRTVLRNIVSPVLTSHRLASTMPNTYVKRTTLFKIPPEHIDKVLKEYETLRKNAVKVSVHSLVSTILPVL